MAYYQIVLRPKEGKELEFIATDIPAAAIAADFGTIPNPEKKSYAILVGNLSAGYVTGTLWIDWENVDWAYCMVYERTELPPP